MGDLQVKPYLKINQRGAMCVVEAANDEDAKATHSWNSHVKEKPRQIQLLGKYFDYHAARPASTQSLVHEICLVCACTVLYSTDCLESMLRNLTAFWPLSKW
jgi:hypothetical protein